MLRDVSTHARAGDFVAVVGESGVGKSTLLRLAIGLEAPASGAVYYDGRDLGRLDARAMRSRIGTVTQDARRCSRERCSRTSSACPRN